MENIFYITEYHKMKPDRTSEIVAYDVEALIDGEMTGIFQYKTGQECTQKCIALEHEYGIKFDKISKKVEYVE